MAAAGKLFTRAVKRGRKSKRGRGIGTKEEIYNLEFIPINHLKNIPFIL